MDGGGSTTKVGREAAFAPHPKLYKAKKKMPKTAATSPRQKYKVNNQRLKKVDTSDLLKEANAAHELISLKDSKFNKIVMRRNFLW